MRRRELRLPDLKFGKRGQPTAKSLAYFLHDRCAQTYDYGARGRERFSYKDRSSDVTYVVSGVGGPHGMDGHYSFDISALDNRTDKTRWTCMIFVSRNLDVSYEEAEGKPVPRELLECALGGW